MKKHLDKEHTATVKKGGFHLYINTFSSASNVLKTLCLPQVLKRGT